MGYKLFLNVEYTVSNGPDYDDRIVNAWTVSLTVKNAHVDVAIYHRSRKDIVGFFIHLYTFL